VKASQQSDQPHETRSHIAARTREHANTQNKQQTQANEKKKKKKKKKKKMNNNNTVKGAVATLRRKETEQHAFSDASLLV
jgi:hypothetical protein